MSWLLPLYGCACRFFFNKTRGTLWSTLTKQKKITNSNNKKYKIKKVKGDMTPTPHTYEHGPVQDIVCGYQCELLWTMCTFCQEVAILRKFFWWMWSFKVTAWKLWKFLVWKSNIWRVMLDTYFDYWYHEITPKVLYKLTLISDSFWSLRNS